MRFLIDADLPRATAGLLERYGHTPVDVRDIGMSSAKDPEIASYALANELILVTGDGGFGNMQDYPPSDYHGFVVLRAPRNATAHLILQILESFLKEGSLVGQLSGRLAIVEPGRIRLRGR
jgi:predicted nuclease of predicted toxin-antitoxin system